MHIYTDSMCGMLTVMESPMAAMTFTSYGVNWCTGPREDYNHHRVYSTYGSNQGLHTMNSKYQVKLLVYYELRVLKLFLLLTESTLFKSIYI